MGCKQNLTVKVSEYLIPWIRCLMIYRDGQVLIFICNADSIEKSILFIKNNVFGFCNVYLRFHEL